MNILYFGKIVDEELHKEDEKKRQRPFSIAQYSYEKAFCDEMCKKSKVNIISIYQTSNFPKEHLFFCRKKKKFKNIEMKYIHYVNIAILKEICFFISAFAQIVKWRIKNRKIKDRCIYANTHYAPVSLAIVLAGKIFKIKKVITFTDLSLFTYSHEKIQKMPFYKKILIKPYIRIVNKLQESYDLYVLFSEPMNEIVNPINKPYIVMEGIYNADNINLNKIKKKNAILHAGTLNSEIGIQKILDVFSKISSQDVELWLIGKGDMDKEIIRAAEKDKRIKFFGFIPKSEVFEYLKKAKLLINLRNPEDIYTKYSFPSKTFEYMVSGTPFFTTKLEGIPSEYYNYLYCIDSYETNRIAEKIKKILEKDETELEEFGLQARKFILENKNAEKQVKKIFDFLQDKI